MAPPAPRPRRALLVALAALLAALTVAGPLASTPPAGAAVVPHHGFRATVHGWSGWYGSYHLGSLGPAWCIDHGLRAPDDAYGYAPGGADGLDPATRSAMAWALARHGTDDPARAAAVTLALHDLMGAQYPFGRLDVDHLGPGDLDGFGGREAEILAIARTVKADALAHGHLRGPLRLVVDAPAVDGGDRGVLSVRLLDAAGAGVADWPVDLSAEGARLDGTQVTTGADGLASIGFEAAVGDNAFHARTQVPDPELDVWSSTTVAAQRVARPRLAQLAADTRFDAAPPTGRVRIDKTGNATAYVPVTGARFELRPDGAAAQAVASLVVGEDGTTDWAEVPAGRYQLVEVQAPPGYGSAPPLTVDVARGSEQVVTVHDRVIRTSLRIEKVDATTGEPVAGAELTLAYDRDADGTPDGEPVTVVTGDGPTQLDDLLPGDYVLTEVTVPGGYRGLDSPIPLTLYPGQPAVVRVPNEPWASVAFEKHPADEAVPDDVDLSGATFEVVADPDAPDHPSSRPTLQIEGGAPSSEPVPDPGATTPAGDPHEGGGEETGPAKAADDPHEGGGEETGPAKAAGDPIGRCTTDERGRCSLPPDALVGGRRYCWREVEAPVGFGLAEPGCFVAGAAGSIVTVAVPEPLLPPPPADTPPDTPPPAPPPAATPPVGPPAITSAPRFSLPRTGAAVTLPALAGLASLVAGGALTAVGRRRRRWGRPDIPTGRR